MLPKTSRCPPNTGAYASRLLGSPRNVFLFYIGGSWVACRDVVNYSFLYGHKELFFKSVKYASCIRRIKKIESQLGVEEKAKFSKTKMRNIIHVELNWWHDNVLRQSIFTAILKYGYGYYFKGTRSKKLFSMFLNGYTKPGLEYSRHYGIIGNIQSFPKKKLENIISK